MSKYNSESVYGTLFTMLDNFSDEDQEYLMDKVFTGDFLENVKGNPSKAYDTLNRVVQDIENGKTDKVTELLSEYADKLYMMKAMLKDYGNFKEKKLMKKIRRKIFREEESLDFVPADVWEKLKDIEDEAEKLDFLKNELGDEFSDEEIESFLNQVQSDLNESIEYPNELTLAELADYLYMFGNDCRMLHLYSVGEEFLTIHALLEELYDLAFDFYDFACESAISHEESVTNPSLIYDRLKGFWQPVTGNAFTQAESVAYIRENGKMLMNCIESIRGYESWVQSGIDDFAKDFDKIINYKISQIAK